MSETDFAELDLSLDKLEAELELTQQVVKDLDEMISQCPASGALEDEPIRTIHHLACTGGTLIAKCIASQANILVLNEVNPFYEFSSSPEATRFAPTNMTALIRQGDSSFCDDELVVELFIKQLEVVRKQCWLTGRVLVIRDHTYSQFLDGDYNSDRPILREVIQKRFPLRSLVTTRDTKKAYHSMVRRRWHRSFRPSTLEEYERRNDIFMDRFSDLPIISYEDFTAEPRQKMQEICEILGLTYFDGFEEVFHTFQFSGDSGRGGNQIISGR
ncbi:MAG: hypothetical protein ABJL18_05545 [Hyphomicrobiales bacterium]